MLPFAMKDVNTAEVRTITPYVCRCCSVWPKWYVRLQLHVENARVTSTFIQSSPDQKFPGDAVAGRRLYYVVYIAILHSLGSRWRRGEENWLRVLTNVTHQPSDKSLPVNSWIARTSTSTFQYFGR